MIDRDKFFENIARVQSRIEGACRRSGRVPQAVTLVAVSKGETASLIQWAAEGGLRHFGENRIQEAITKIPQLTVNVSWHLIGTLQNNKAGKALDLGFTLIQSVDRWELAQRLSRLAQERNKLQEVLLEVNIAKESSKHGWDPQEVAHRAAELSRLEGLRVVGLMGMGPLASEVESNRPHFRRAKEIWESLTGFFPEFKILSMGMSQDFEVAVEEGSTMVRIGRAIFQGEGLSC